MLTPKREKFVQNLVKGMSQREAYKKSYDAKNMSNEAIDVAACRLFADTNIRIRYDELMNKAVDKAVMSANDRMKWLTDVIMNKLYEEDGDGFKPADLNTKMKAMDILNKMTGEYVQKIEAEVGLTEIKVDIDE